MRKAFVFRNAFTILTILLVGLLIAGCVDMPKQDSQTVVCSVAESFLDVGSDEKVGLVNAMFVDLYAEAIANYFTTEEIHDLKQIFEDDEVKQLLAQDITNDGGHVWRRLRERLNELARTEAILKFGSQDFANYMSNCLSEKSDGLIDYVLSAADLEVSDGK